MRGVTAEVDNLRRRVIDLWNRHADTELLGLRAELEQDTEMWARLWARATTGATWAPQPYSPVFQDHHWLGTDLLTTDLTALYPDLNNLRMGLAGSRANPALRLTALHPFAAGFELRDGDHVEVVSPQPGPVGLPTARVPIPTTPGRHDLEILIHTPYSVLRRGSVSYLVRES